MLGALLAIWEGWVRLAQVSSLFLTAPSDVARAAIALFASGALVPHILQTTLEFTIGLGLAIVAGLVLGVLMGRIGILWAVTDPWAMMLYSIPTVALLPLFVVAFGAGTEAKIVLVFLGALFPILFNTQTGVANVDPRYVEVGRSFGASRLQLMLKVGLPAATSYVLAGIRLAIVRALIMVFVAEMFSANVGLGFWTMRQSVRYQTSDVLVGTLLFTVAGVMMVSFVRLAEQRLAPWIGAR